MLTVPVMSSSPPRADKLILRLDDVLSWSGDESETSPIHSTSAGPDAEAVPITNLRTNIECSTIGEGNEAESSDSEGSEGCSSFRLAAFQSKSRTFSGGSEGCSSWGLAALRSKARPSPQGPPGLIAPVAHPPPGLHTPPLLANTLALDGPPGLDVPLALRSPLRSPITLMENVSTARAVHIKKTGKGAGGPLFCASKSEQIGVSRRCSTLNLDCYGTHSAPVDMSVRRHAATPQMCKASTQRKVTMSLDVFWDQTKSMSPCRSDETGSTSIADSSCRSVCSDEDRMMARACEIATKDFAKARRCTIGLGRGIRQLGRNAIQSEPVSAFAMPHEQRRNIALSLAIPDGTQSAPLKGEKAHRRQQSGSSTSSESAGSSFGMIDALALECAAGSFARIFGRSLDAH